MQYGLTVFKIQKVPFFRLNVVRLNHLENSKVPLFRLNAVQLNRIQFNTPYYSKILTQSTFRLKVSSKIRTIRPQVPTNYAKSAPFNLCTQ